MTETVEILVTCPRCEHTHAIEVDETELVRNPVEQRLYRLSDLERILGLSRRTLLTNIYETRLAAFKPGTDRRWHVKASDLAEFRRQREQE